MKLNRHLPIWAIGAFVAASLLIAVSAFAAGGGGTPPTPQPAVMAAPINGADLSANHPVLANAETQVKMVVRLKDPAANYDLTWSMPYYNGTAICTPPPTAPLYDREIAEVDCYIPAAPLNTTFTTTLTLTEYEGTTPLTDVSASYTMQVVDGSSLDDLRNIAVDRGLWWMHKNMYRRTDTTTGVILGEIENDGWDPGLVSDGFGLQAFTDHGHYPRDFTNEFTNPYVQDARRLLNEIGRMLVVRNAADLVKNDVPTGYTHDNNQDGLVVYPYHDHLEYEFGVILRALASADLGNSTPQISDEGKNKATGNNTSIVSQGWKKVMANMVDFIAWAQLHTYPNVYASSKGYDAYRQDTSPYNSTYVPNKVTTDTLDPISRGAWPYWQEGWRSHAGWGSNAKWGDVAPAFWTVLGLKAAANEANIEVPTFIADELRLYVDQKYCVAYEGGNCVAATPNDKPGSALQNLDSTSGEYGEVYFGPNNGYYGKVNFHYVERAAEWLVLLDYAGVGDTDERVAKAKLFIQNNWYNKHNYNMGQYHDGPYSSDEPDYGIFSLFDIEHEQIENLPYPNDHAHYGTYGQNYNFWHFYEVDGTGKVKWGWQDGYFSAGAWVPIADATGPDVNVFATFAVRQAMDTAYGDTSFPGTSYDSLTYMNRFKSLLADAQLPDGGFDNRNWVYGSPFGTPWAMMVLE